MDGSLWGGGFQDTNGHEKQFGSSPPRPRSRPPFYVQTSSASEFTEKSWDEKSWSAKPASSANGFSPKRFLGKLLSKVSARLPCYSPWSRKLVLELPSSNGRCASPLRTIRLFNLRYPRASILLLLLGILVLMMLSPIVTRGFRTSRHFGGGNRFVIILAANKGGGVMEWKTGNQWATERESIANKQDYAERWGYHLEVKDMSTKKRYAHEWRESWEKVDIIKQTMRQYPKAEWFWWLDLNTYVMEPSVSLQSHIFNKLPKVTYRDINVYNPLNVTHPPSGTMYPYLTELEKSPIGDGLPSSINLIIPQDCGGFNLGSFFVRRSEWSERLLDIWWDPVSYEQLHMDWEHKEQDALEYLYINQPWIRPSTAFIPQRMINAFPPGACAQSPDDPQIFYNENDRDFVVNMAGCEWGRDCWEEMSTYKQLSQKLQETSWTRFFSRGK